MRLQIGKSFSGSNEFVDVLVLSIIKDFLREEKLVICFMLSLYLVINFKSNGTNKNNGNTNTIELNWLNVVFFSSLPLHDTPQTEKINLC
jgi:hypothetical protein